MNKTFGKFAVTLALAIGAAGLSPNVASAQTLQRVNLERINPQVLRAEDFPAVRIANPRPVVDDAAWPAAVGAVAGIVYAVVEVVHRVTESWMPPSVSFQRGNLVSLGVYDR